MLFLFFSFLEIFIPYQPTDKYELPELNKTALQKLVATNTSIVAFAVEKRYKEMDPVIASMNEVASLFSEQNVTFVFLERNAATDIAYSNSLGLPSFFHFNHGELISAHQFPRYDGTFVKIVQSIISSTVTIEDKDKLHAYLGDCYYTILALPELYEKALEIIGQNVNEIDIVVVNKKLLTDLDLDEDRLALFRREDNMIVSFSNYSIASIPYYSVLNYYTLYQETRPVFGISGPSYTEEIKELLYELSEKHPNVLFGFIGSDYYQYMNSTCRIILDKSSLNVTIFNSNVRYHYDISDIFTSEFLSSPYDFKSWIKLSNQAIYSVLKNERKKIFISAPIPPSDVYEKETVKTVVGLTFEDFVNQPNKDSLILFNGHRVVQQHQQINQTIHDLYEISQNMSIVNLSIGQIDVTVNSGNFPFITGIPSIVMYPMANKSNPVTLRGTPSIDNIMWFVSRYSSYDINITVEPMSKRQFEIEFQRLMRQTLSMNEDEKEKFFDWAYEMANLTHSDIAHMSGVPHRHHEHHDGHHHHHDKEGYDEL